MAAQNRIRVLLIDDDEDDFLIIQNTMKHMEHTPFSLEWASSAARGRKRIAEKDHDVYLVDYRIGKDSGLDLIGEFSVEKRIEPFIILTGAGDEAIERQAMKMGVADYIVKGTFDAQLLSRVLRYSMQRKQMEAQRIEYLLELNRSKDEFIALASHQLRTPATAVKQYVSMVLEGYGGPITNEQRMLLASAYDGNERQLQIVNDILRVAKLDLEKIVLQKRKFNISEILRHIVNDLSSTIDARDQTIDLKVPNKPLMVRVDSEYIRMALGNIVDNASKYTPEDKTIYISARVSKNNHIAVTVRDEGVGIAKEDMTKLFKKFSRIDNPLSVIRGGTGLGLYWSSKIIEMHGGTITVTSELGEGTSFTINLPVS